MADDVITDCHIHIQPMEMLKPEAFELIKSKSNDFDRIMEFCRSPKAFLNYLDDFGHRARRSDQLCCSGSHRA